mmetsp:Transcript_30415/g.50192  ORF Transcript_30415/g.50192 Transcript_30415/m.50192 type:complete len:226 (-) Transcript_30415:268-945(-)
MVQGILGSDTILRIVRQQSFQQVKTMVVQIVSDSLAVGGLDPLWECSVPVLKLSNATPHILGWCSELTENLEQLVNLRVTREERTFGDHLNENGSNSPHINRRSIRLGSKENLRRTVPKGNDLVGERSNRRTERSGKTKVSQLESSISRDKQVLRLEITVHHTTSMAECKATTALKEIRLDKKWRKKSTARLHVLLQILIKKLKHQVQLSFRLDAILKLNNVLMS